ncbi:MAG: hypothetical protein M1282_01990 [Chloroflexi bacterium]|nr:hypothetical protein [Chloroflexota bacterium]
MDLLFSKISNIRLDVHYQFTSQDGGTLLIEQMLISAPALVSSYVISTAQRVQEQTLANLKRRLEAEQAA